MHAQDAEDTLSVVMEDTTGLPDLEALSEEELDILIQVLLEEIEKFEDADLEHYESVQKYQLTWAYADPALIREELIRIRERQDYYQNFRDYILQIQLLKPDEADEYVRMLDENIQQFREDRFVVLSLLYSKLELLYAKSDYLQYIKTYEAFKHYFPEDDLSLFKRLNEAYLSSGQADAAAQLAESIYNKYPDDHDAYMIYADYVVHTRNYPELEFLTDKMLMYEDAPGLTELALLQFEKQQVPEGTATAHFVEAFIGHYLWEKYAFSLDDFQWYYNQKDMLVGVQLRFTDEVRLIPTEKLFTLARYVAIQDEALSCRLMKYAYMSTFSYWEYLDERKRTYFLRGRDLSESMNILDKKRAEVLSVQDMILRSYKCD